MDGLLSHRHLQHIVAAGIERNAAPFTGYLIDPDPHVRARAAFTLASIQDSMLIPDLLKLVSDTDERVRADAAFALGQSAGSVSGFILLEALRKETDADAQREWLDALGRKGDAAALDLLVRTNLDKRLRPFVAITIARFALRGIQTQASVAYLVDILQSGVPDEMIAASYFFARAPDPSFWSPVADSIRAILQVLPAHSPAAMYLVTGLEKQKYPGDTELMINRLQISGDWRVRVNAVRAIGQRSNETVARTVLRAALNDSSRHVAQTAAAELSAARWDAEESTQIRAFINRPGLSWQIVAPLLKGLAANGQPAPVLEFIRKQAHVPAHVLNRYLEALSAIPGDESFGILSAAAVDADKHVAAGALTTLAERWKSERTQPDATARYYPIFLQGLRRLDLATTYIAAEALADSLFLEKGSAEVMSEVYQQLEAPRDIEPMLAILASLGAGSDPRSLEILRLALDHSNPLIRQAAARSITRRTGTEPAVSGRNDRPDRTIDWTYLSGFGVSPHLVIETDRGRVVVELYPEEAPLTCQTLLQLSEKGQFDGVPFHRVVANFVIQGGDFERGDGYGGPGFSIRSEFTRVRYERGTVGMASAGKDTEGSQFFVTHSMQPHLDGRYTAFGRVSSGMDVVDQILEGDLIRSVRIERNE